jgi:hypothetical protein
MKGCFVQFLVAAYEKYAHRPNSDYFADQS